VRAIHALASGHLTCSSLAVAKHRILWLRWKHIDVLFLVVQPMCGAEWRLVSGGFFFFFSIPPSFLSSPCQGMVVSYHLFFVSNLVLILLIAICFVFQGIVVSYHLFFVSNLVIFFWLLFVLFFYLLLIQFSP
jgi:hypothetical protein